MDLSLPQSSEVLDTVCVCVCNVQNSNAVTTKSATRRNHEQKHFFFISRISIESVLLFFFPVYCFLLNIFLVLILSLEILPPPLLVFHMHAQLLKQNCHIGKKKSEEQSNYRRQILTRSRHIQTDFYLRPSSSLLFFSFSPPQNPRDIYIRLCVALLYISVLKSSCRCWLKVDRGSVISLFLVVLCSFLFFPAFIFCFSFSLGLC